ncbi:MAG: hypothetical protein IKZ31_03650 [Lentisphaeria bacterium]|nr:hypothetical protein [Lentisphaeria bacterium]
MSCWKNKKKSPQSCVRGKGKTFCGKRAAAGWSAVASLSSLRYPALSTVVSTKAEPLILFHNFLCSLFLLRCRKKKKRDKNREKNKTICGWKGLAPMPDELLEK